MKLLLLLNTTTAWAEEKIELFPSTPFYQYIIYENLTLFWLAILGLLVLIRMKLKECERLQKLEFFDEKERH